MRFPSFAVLVVSTHGVNPAVDARATSTGLTQSFPILARDLRAFIARDGSDDPVSILEPSAVSKPAEPFVDNYVGSSKQTTAVQRATILPVKTPSKAPAKTRTAPAPVKPAPGRGAAPGKAVCLNKATLIGAVRRITYQGRRQRSQKGISMAD